MKTRKELNEELSSKKREIDDILSQMNEIKKQLCLLCDSQQRYVEKTETVGRGKKKKEVLIGRIYFPEDFRDEDTGDIITIERSQIVKIDNFWHFETEFTEFIERFY